MAKRKKQDLRNVDVDFRGAHLRGVDLAAPFNPDRSLPTPRGGTHNLLTTDADTDLDAAYNAAAVDASAGNRVITLPDASDALLLAFYVSKRDASANTVTVTPAAGTINGAASHVLTAQYQSAAYLSDGTEYLILGMFP